MDNSHRNIAYTLILFNLTELLGSGYTIWNFLNIIDPSNKIIYLLIGAFAGVVILNLFLVSTSKCASYLKNSNEKR